MNKKILLMFLILFILSVGVTVAFVCGATMEEIIIPFLMLLYVFLQFGSRKGGNKP